MLRVSLILVALCTLSAHATAETQQDAAIERKLDGMLGLNLAPTNAQELQAIVLTLNENTPVESYVRTRVYQALALGVNQGQPDEAQRILDAAYQKAKTSNNANAIVDVLTAQAEIHLLHHDHTASMLLVPRIEQYLPRVERARVKYHAYHLIGRTLQEFDDFEQALTYMLLAQEVVAATNDDYTQRRRQFLNMHIARIQSNLTNYEGALELLNNTIKESYEQGLTGRLPELYLIKGYALQHLHGPVDDAVEAFSQAVRAGDATRPDRTRMLAFNNLGAVYLLRQDYDRALSYLLQSLAIAQDLSLGIEQNVTDFNIAYVMVMQGEFAEGLPRMHQAFQQFQSHASLAEQATMSGLLANAYQTAGRLEDENELLRQHLRLREQAFRSERDKVFSELQVRYGAEEQNLRIRLLEQESALNEERLRTQQRSFIWFSGALILLLLSLSLILMSHRKSKRLNKLLNEANRELHIQSQQDPLTGLMNRRALYQYTGSEQRQLHAYHMLVLLDIDLFKQINDRYGHQTGDQILCEVAARLKRSVRASDKVVRWGGEEFLLVLPGMTVEKQADILRALLRGVIAEPVDTEHGPIHITMSGGSLCVPSGEEQLGWQNALKIADTLLYRSKNQGRNRVTALQRSLRKAVGAEYNDSELMVISIA